MSDSDPVFSPTAATRPGRRLPEIAMVGSRSNFSDSLVRATGKDLRDLTLIHVPSLDAVNALPPDQTRWLRLLVIDDTTIRNASAETIRAFSCPPAASIVLAFLDYGLAASLYRATDKLLPIDSYVPLDVRLDLWLSILKLLLHGGKYIPEKLLAHHPDGRRTMDGAPAQNALTLGLTPRQYGVLELVAAGLPNKVIAARLGLSDHTVKLHIHNIITKLGVTNRTEAAARYHEGVP